MEPVGISQTHKTSYHRRSVPSFSLGGLVLLYSRCATGIPALIGPSQWCACNAFHYDVCGDHWQTCQGKSAAAQVHDWVVYRLGDILGSVGHKVKIHKITPATGKERGDLEIKDYVVLQKPQEKTDRLPPPRTLILDFTMTHPRYGRSLLNVTGQLTNTRRSDGAPEPDGVIKVVARKKILHNALNRVSSLTILGPPHPQFQILNFFQYLKKKQILEKCYISVKKKGLFTHIVT